MLVWMVLFTPGALLHAGNFPDMASCLAAAQQTRQAAVSGNAAPASPGVLCVPAHTGRPGDPPAP